MKLTGRIKRDHGRKRIGYDWTAPGALASALEQQSMLGTREFYLRRSELSGVLRCLLGKTPSPLLCLNRPHSSGKSMIHRVEWCGMIFTCVTNRQLRIG